MVSRIYTAAARSSNVVCGGQQGAPVHLQQVVAGNKPTSSAQITKINYTREARLRIQKALGQHDDLGTQSMGRAATASLSAPRYIKKIHKLGVAGLEVAKTGTLATVTIANTIVFKGAQSAVAGSKFGNAAGLSPKFLERAKRMKIIDAIPAGKASATIAQGYLSRLSTGRVLYSQAIRTKLHKTRISQSVVRGVKRVQRVGVTIKKVARSVVATGRGVGRAAVGAYVIVRGLRQGTLTPKAVAQNTFVKARGAVSAALPKAGAAIKTATANTVTWTVKRGIPTAGKLSLNSAISITRRLGANDMAIQGVHNSLVIAKYGGRATRKTIQTGKVATRGTVRAIKTSVKRGTAAARKVRPLWRTARRIGVRASARAAGRWAARRTGGTLARAGYSITNLAISTVSKFALPLILGLVMIIVLYNLITMPVQAIGAIFGRSSEGVDWLDLLGIIEVDHYDFVHDVDTGVPVLHEAWLSGLANYINGQLGGGYDRVRLHTDLDMLNFSSSTTTAILEPHFIDAYQWGNLAMPIFSTIMLVETGGIGNFEMHMAALTISFDIIMTMTSDEDIEFYCWGHWLWDDELDDYVWDDATDDYYIWYCEESDGSWEDTGCFIRRYTITTEFTGFYQMARIIILNPLEEAQEARDATAAIIDSGLFGDDDEEGLQELLNTLDYMITELETALEIFLGHLELLEEELDMDLIPPELLLLLE